MDREHIGNFVVVAGVVSKWSEPVRFGILKSKCLGVYGIVSVARGLNHASEIIIFRSQKMFEAWFPSPQLMVYLG